VLDSLRHHFRPEFLNRVDEIIVFHSLTEEDLKQIVDIQLDRLRGRLAERRITLELTDAAKGHLALAGYDPVYGARPLKRAIQREIETPLSRLILKGDVKDNTVLRIEVSNGAITFSQVPLAAEAEATH
jgi:ATP-dependent Clp protease ATP-binding subunit ClpB